ncbi:sulfite exporter TauE/SafE family protein [Aeromicrobium sp. CTD01-1L150]|uniref:sulfite exporter TauE/SafE family protein n=1 Tax=Aeromicrobium sp. CTD01-1L150 TaxID=3341830 RepID=UPI0035C07B38
MLAGAAAVFLAAFLGGVVGFAYALVALPLLLLVGLPLEEIVVINLVIALVTRILVLATRWRDVTWPRASRMVVGALPGTAAGLWAMGRVTEQNLQIAAGLVVLLAVAGLIARDRWGRGEAVGSGPARGRPSMEWAVGTMGGFLGSTTSLNGVPPALLLAGRRTNARQVVADLAVFFVAGNLGTLVLLGIGGRLPIADVTSFLTWWLPVALAGTWLGVRLGPLLPMAIFRRLTLGVIVASALIGLFQGLVH